MFVQGPGKPLFVPCSSQRQPLFPRVRVVDCPSSPCYTTKRRDDEAPAARAGKPGRMKFQGKRGMVRIRRSV